MTGTQIAILILAVACILNAINCQLLNRQNKLMMDLVEETLEEVGNQLKDNLFFSKQLKESYKKLSVLLDSIKKD